MPFDELDVPLALGLVPVEGRGSLPFALYDGESLLACASWALTEAGVELFDYNVPWPLIREAGRPVVVHDPLCPTTPVSFIEALVADSADAVLVGVHPVTDTLKRVSEDGTVGETVDRAEWQQVVSPVVLPAAVVATLAEAPVGALADLVDDLRARGVAVECRDAPAQARRISSEADLALL